MIIQFLNHMISNSIIWINKNKNITNKKKPKEKSMDDDIIKLNIIKI